MCRWNGCRPTNEGPTRRGRPSGRPSTAGLKPVRDAIIIFQPLALFVALAGLAAPHNAPPFELVQPELFSASGGMPNAWADFDNDGDLDEFVGFRGRPNRLYRQDPVHFEAAAVAVHNLWRR